MWARTKELGAVVKDAGLRLGEVGGAAAEEERFGEVEGGEEALEDGLDGEREVKHALHAERVAQRGEVRCERYERYKVVLAHAGDLRAQQE